MIKNPSSFSFLAEMLWSCDLRRLKSACKTYAAASMPRATINPKVGMAKGPRCRKGIMDARASDSFESIHDAVCALGVLERWQRRRSETEYSFRGHRSGWSGAAMKGGTEDEPYGQGYPFGVGEVAGESGDQLHEKKKQGDADTEARDEAQAQARLDEPEERQAASQPSAEAIEPTSVTGTRMASPRNSAIRVPTVMPMIATDGVENFSWMVAKRGAMVPRRAYAKSKRVEAAK